MKLYASRSGSGPPLALLHPLGIHSGFLEPLEARLALHFSVTRIDLRGHGRSVCDSQAGSLAAFAADVAETLAAAGAFPCALSGFAFGGMVAQQLALDRPADVSALIACASPGTLPVEARRLALERADQVERGGMQAVVEATMRRWFNDAFREAGGHLEARAALLDADPRAWCAAWRAAATLDTLPRMAMLEMPVLCIGGEADRSVPASAVERLARSIPGAAFDTIPNGSHMMCIEQPDEVAGSILRFLGAGGALPGNTKRFPQTGAAHSLRHV
jgi:3-oxoadipate enol-lactonase